MLRVSGTSWPAKRMCTDRGEVAVSALGCFLKLKHYREASLSAVEISASVKNPYLLLCYAWNLRDLNHWGEKANYYCNHG